MRVHDFAMNGDQDQRKSLLPKTEELYQKLKAIDIEDGQADGRAPFR